MRHLIALSLGLLLTSTSTLAATPIVITPDKPGIVIDRHIFGQFAEHLGHGIYGGIWVGKDSTIPNTRGIRNDVVAALKELHVPDVRWPGGCFADEYHWRRGIGPQDKRKSAVNTNWGGVGEPNSFGTEEFMDFAQQIGTEAYVSVNVGSGTPGEAAEWLEYMTSSTDDSLGRERADNGHAAPYKVAMLGIGNEAWGCGGSMTPEFYVDQMKLYAHFVHNYNNAQPMKRIAVGPDSGKTEYTEAVMKAWTEHTWAWDLEGISLHNYTVPEGWPPHSKSTDFSVKDYAVTIKAALEMDGLISKHEAIMDKYDPAKKLALVVDEWGAWLAPAPGTNPGFLIQQNSQRDAVLAALHFNIFARHGDRVRMANIAQMINVLQAMILTDNDKMLLTPTYHVFKMYVPFQDAKLLPVQFDQGKTSVNDIALPNVDVIAAKSKEGKIWLAITNIDPNKSMDFDVSEIGVKISKAEGQTLKAPNVNSINTFAAPKTVTPSAISAKSVNGKLVLSLAPASVSVVELIP